jgi:hypothetical protein
MQTRTLAAFLLTLLPLATASAADVDIRVIAAGEIAPGVYGRVDIGTGGPPPLVYEQPRIIVKTPQAVPVQPVYLHVPPGHAKHWAKHCKRYNACGQPVYFVRSAEYDKPKKQKKEKKEH